MRAFSRHSASFCSSLCLRATMISRASRSCSAWKLFLSRAFFRSSARSDAFAASTSTRSAASSAARCRARWAAYALACSSNILRSRSFFSRAATFSARTAAATRRASACASRFTASRRWRSISRARSFSLSCALMMRAASASLRLFSALRRSSSSASATALQAVRRRQSRGTSSLDGGREPRGAGAGAGAGRRGRRVDMAAARCAAAISRATFSGSSDFRRSASRRARFSGLPFHIGGLATTAPGRSSGKGFLPASGSPFLGRAKDPMSVRLLSLPREVALSPKCRLPQSPLWSTRSEVQNCPALSGGR